MDRTRFVTLGKIVGVFGVDGWVKVYSYTREREEILSFNPWYVGRGGEYRQRRLLGGRRQGAGLVARLEGCVDREQSRSLIDSDIAVPVEVLPKLDDGKYYWAQLASLQVVNLRDETLGVVERLMDTGANDVLVVKGERERLIPYIPRVIRQVDLANRLIRVDWDADF